MYSKVTIWIADIYESLKTLGLPVYMELPDETVIEPFFVIGTHFDDDSRSAKNGPILSTELQIDLFFPTGKRVELEELIWATKNVLKRRRQITSSIRIEDGTRSVYHVIFQVSDSIY
ncbi:hypothetical protein [Enterococcus faecalis]|uniref:hypothetical protein n=1 Tax=Enterococcus faecalis TaxID=1351 RepID=UPI003D13920A